MNFENAINVFDQSMLKTLNLKREKPTEQFRKNNIRKD